MRKLASIQPIAKLRAHPDADKLDIATILGWETVVERGKFQQNELAVWFEVDSWIPHDLAPFLTRGGDTPKTYEGVLGQKLKTVRLRGQLSQGLLLPIKAVLDYIESKNPEKLDDILVQPGVDLTEPLGILKWEAPVPAQLAGQVRGSFPSFLKRTDQERIQNLPDWFDTYRHLEFEATMKLDGSSMTVYYNDGDFGVCSRNLNLKPSEDNTLWNVAIETNLLNSLKLLGKNLAVQGELMGEGVQGNRENLKGHMMYVFDIWDIDKQRHCTPTERQALMTNLEALGSTVKHVPVLHKSIKIFEVCPTMDELLGFADGPSLVHLVREGVVFKALTSVHGVVPSFKAISNKFLLKQ